MATITAYHDELLCDLVTSGNETAAGLSVAVEAAVGTVSGFIVILIVAATFCLYQWRSSKRYYVLYKLLECLLLFSLYYDIFRNVDVSVRSNTTKMDELRQTYVDTTYKTVANTNDYTDMTDETVANTDDGYTEAFTAI